MGERFCLLCNVTGALEREDFGELVKMCVAVEYSDASVFGGGRSDQPCARAERVC